MNSNFRTFALNAVPMPSAKKTRPSEDVPAASPAPHRLLSASSILFLAKLLTLKASAAKSLKSFTKTMSSKTRRTSSPLNNATNRNLSTSSHRKSPILSACKTAKDGAKNRLKICLRPSTANEPSVFPALYMHWESARSVRQRLYCWLKITERLKIL